MFNKNKSSAFRNIGVPFTEIMMVLMLFSTWNELIPSVGGFLGIFSSEHRVLRSFLDGNIFLNKVLFFKETF